MIEDLIIFTNELISPNHEVILLVDVNEAFISSECGLSKLTRKTNITDPIFNQNGSHLEPNTHKSGISRIDYAFCTPRIEKFITRCGITSFDLFTSSDHRGICLDVKKLSSLKTITTLPTPKSRLLISTNPGATTQYKKDLMRFFLQHNVFPNINIIQTKIDNTFLNENDMIYVNKYRHYYHSIHVESRKEIQTFFSLSPMVSNTSLCCTGSEIVKTYHLLPIYYTP